MDLDLSLIQSTSLLAYLIVFAGGVLTSLGLCNVATIPLIVGFVGGSHDINRRRAFTLSSSFGVGLALTFMLMGIAASLVGLWIGGGSNWSDRAQFWTSKRPAGSIRPRARLMAASSSRSILTP